MCFKHAVLEALKDHTIRVEASSHSKEDDPSRVSCYICNWEKERPRAIMMKDMKQDIELIPISELKRIEQIGKENELKELKKLLDECGISIEDLESHSLLGLSRSNFRHSEPLSNWIEKL